MPELDPTAIGARLQLLRESRGLSQRELSAKVQIAQSAISDFEKGKRMPTARAINKLLNFFDVSPGELMATPQKDPKEAKRRFLIRRVEDVIEEMSLEEIQVIAQFINQIARLGAAERQLHIPFGNVGLTAPEDTATRQQAASDEFEQDQGLV